MVTPKPVKKAAPRKTVPPAKFVTPDVSSQNINNWQDNQPVGALVDGVEFTEVPDEEEGSRVEERAPRIPSPVVSKVRDFAERAKSAVPRKGTSKVRLPRVPIDKLIGHAWQMLAQMAQPINVPVARILDMQAPVAGLVLEGVVKDTIIDRLLQPIARVEAGGEIIFALMGPPILVGVLTQKPQLAPLLVPILRESLRTWIDVAGPQLEEVAKREQKFQDQYGQRIDDMIAMIFYDPEVEQSATN